MFNFLKKKLKSPEAPPAESPSKGGGIDMDEGIRLIALRDSTLIFESASVFPLAQTLDLTASIPEDDGTTKRRRANVILRDSKLLESQVHEYVGDLEDASPELRAFMMKVISHQEGERRKAALARGDQRIGGRAQMKFQVMSPDIKNFKAMSGDISATGIKIFVDHELPKGKIIELMMNFDDDNFPHVKCRAEVMWCRPTDKNHAVGLRFTSLTPQQQDTVERYIEFVQKFRERMS